MNPVVLSLLFAGLVVVALVVLALLVDHSRALELERAENRALRDRMQIARLVVTELVDRPDAPVVELAQQWLREEQHDPRRIVQAARRARETRACRQ